MRRTAEGMRRALVKIAAGTEGLGTANVSHGFAAAVRVAREALALCRHCRRQVADQCGSCDDCHPGSCCGCAECMCPCSMEG